MVQVTITLEDIEYKVLEREYKIRGLDEFHTGNNPTPRDNVTKKIVEGIKKNERKNS